jgi:transposase InsO family protein
MPFEEAGNMSPKKEFVILATQPEANVSQLCQRFGVSRTTGYKWLGRFVREGESGLENRSRRPRHSPRKVDAATEELVLLIRDERPTWGARKIKRFLEDQGEDGLPSPSTITEILRRNNRLDAEGVAKKWKRFECDEPMGLLQMDFKGHFKTKFGRCHPLTVLDDHSRYILEIGACTNELGDTVKGLLKEVFRRYGLPRAIITDNGMPWGMAGYPKSITGLALWLIRLGIELKRSGVRHPQTMGKLERMHRTLKAEVIQARQFGSIAECQRAFDEWREDYNFKRPHEAIDFLTPSERFRVSDIAFPERMPQIEYSPDDMIRKVSNNGQIHFNGRRWRVGKGMKGFPVAVREVEDDIFNVVFVRQIVLRINLRDAPMGASERWP